MADIGEMGRDIVKIGVTLLIGLVANAPEDYRRMVPVAVDHRDEILVRPVVEHCGIAVGFLGKRPGV